MKALGIVFAYDASVQMQTNFYEKLKDIRTQTRLWSCRGLSLYGKITIIKSFLLHKVFYIFSLLPSPEVFIKQLNTIVYNFPWRGPDKIARLAVINDLKYGGLNLTDLETSVKSLRLAWLGRLFAEGSSPWKALLIIYSNNSAEFSYLGVIMISKNTILTLYFIKNSFGGGQILEQDFRQKL